jgi:hypothetical protein
LSEAAAALTGIAVFDALEFPDKSVMLQIQIEGE